ncbi:helix-turn-helix transcriptional regulator [Wenzhouxiangella sp. EGI_FJ10305]|uniref:helix-turn-helix transcriptional regulator n=1 Tax=Wenzhouxiangella sp. EGI_FJ10305 TaxID=3243768 RepID=UPI0035D7D80B
MSLPEPVGWRAEGVRFVRRLGAVEQYLGGSTGEGGLRMGEIREDAIQALYGAAMGTVSWFSALDALAGFAGSRVVTLDTYDLEEQVGEVLTANAMPDPSIESYNREFGRGNFQIETVSGYYQPGKVVRTSDFISQKELLSSDIFNHVYKPMGIRWAAGVALEVGDRYISEFSFMKAIDGNDHTERELKRIRSMVPHLRQAWLGFRHIEQLEASIETVTTLWDRFDHAVVVIDSKRSIQFANRLAEEFLSAGRAWVSRAGRLHMRHSQDDQAFGEQLGEVLNGKARLLRLSTGSFGSDFVSSLVRLDERSVALIVTDPARNNSDWRQGLMMRFHLTPAEAEVVNSVVEGESLKRFAERAGIAYETARSQMKSAMRKNSWRRQGDVVADVLKALLPAELFKG